MNYSTAILVINDDARCIKVTYETDEPGRLAPRQMFKTFDKKIKVDDFVVVPTDTRHKLTVSKVVEVDADDWMGTSAQIPWIVGSVDLADVNRIKESEDTAISALKSAEKLKQRRELQASMLAAVAESSEAMKALSNVNAAPAHEEAA